MGKFLEGWERARKAAEEREAEKRRRQQVIATALEEVSAALDEDREELGRHGLAMKMEHGALVMSRKHEPVASVTFDPDKARFHIHRYTATEGNTELDAESAADCAAKLGEYAYSLGA
jgi:hypothetical protein